MTNRSPYDVLGLPRSATGGQVRAAYVELARRHHPDSPGGSHDRMQEVNNAWAVLSVPELRRSLDLALGEPPYPDSHGGEWSPSPGGDIDLGEKQDSGTPVAGVAKGIIAFAPICFVAGLVIFILGVVLQVAQIVQSGLIVLLLSVIAFLMAPFLAMGASIQRSTVASSTDNESDSEETQ